MQSSQTSTDLSSAAVAYADAGWRIFPIWPISPNGRCYCGNHNCQDAGKHPATHHGHNDATDNLAIVKKWWISGNYGIGYATGYHVVIDFDLYKNPDALADFPHDLPETRVALTGGGGEHYYYSVTSDVKIANKIDWYPGVDIRGEGGYVVLPPSPHVSGRDYAWEDPFKPIAELPDELVKILSAPKREPIPRILTSYRNPTMAQIAGALRRVGCDEEHMAVMLHAFNRHFCFPPKSEREVERIAKSISRYPSKAELEADKLRKAREISDRYI